MANSNLKISLFPVNENLKIDQIASAGDYIIYKHLNKNLIESDPSGQIYGDLAEQWIVSKNHTTFEFKIKDDVLFSDGSPITSNDVIYSIHYLIDKKGGIHYDFSNIKDTNIIDEKKFTITLKTSNPRFLRGLSHPEFGIRKASKLIEEQYQITSGCYTLKEKSNNKIILRRNSLCKEFKNSHQEVQFGFTKPNEQKASIEKAENDFYISMLQDNDLKDIVAKGKYNYTSPHIGFTFWLTINPNSKNFSSLKNRKSLYSNFKKKFVVNEGIDTVRAEQLYLPNGPGRLNVNEITQITKDQQSESSDLSKMNVKVLLPKSFNLNEDLIKYFKNTFKTVDIDFYSNQKEFIEIDYKKYDLFLTNNDFSSIDLYENISVTFNPIRPLIFKNIKIEKSLNMLSSVSEEEKLFQEYRNIAKEILKDALIIPVIHKKVIFIKRKNIDISEWSEIYPEISIWKMKIQD